MKNLKGTILRIEKISLNDGDGMRTVVFFKGCPMHCAWCSTPESQKAAPEVYFMKHRCRGCNACVAVCPNGALTFVPPADETERPMILRDHEKCTDCFKCVDACNYRAQQIYGKEMSVKEVMREIEKDELFYFYSNGGVTLSGGDVFCQPEFVSAILDGCEDLFINTCAELDMLTTRENIEAIIPRLDNFYTDVKLMDSEAHKKWTGAGNEVILENIRLADTICKKNAIHARLPFVEGVNDSRENIAATVEFCRSLKNCSELEFLPYHRLGVHAYEQLQRDYALIDNQPMNRLDVYKKMSFILEEDLPFAVKISGMKLYDPATGIVPVTEEELRE